MAFEPLRIAKVTLLNRSALFKCLVHLSRLRAALATKAGEQRQSLADYLESVCKGWQPKIPLAEIADVCTDQARTLRAALLPALQRMLSPTLSPADHVRLGLEGYQRAFGHKATERHWRRLLDRTLRRAGSEDNFERLELYLPENPTRKAPDATFRAQFDFKPLADYIATFNDSDNPTEGDKAALWSQTFKLFAAGADTKRERKQLRRAIAKQLHQAAPWLAVDDATAHLERDYSKLVSMQVIGADDLTAPVYFYVPDGNGWFNLTRGQVLAMVDSRSLKVIAWSLQPERNCNAMVIRTLMNRVCASWGVPRCWAFERGIWESSHLVKGSIPAGWQGGLSAPDCATGWEQMGVRFVHSIRARSKPVERVFGAIQDLMEGVRGYCGRDERRDCPAVTKQAKLDLEFHRVNHPGELFLSFDEWQTEFGTIIERYSATSQDGKVLRGLSPDEAFEKCWPHDNPPTRLDASCWHLLAHYTKPVTVNTNGIEFRIGGKKYVYRSERTGQDRGQNVLAHFDPECPEILCVTDLNRKNPYLVERATDVDFMAEPDDSILQRELGKAASHSLYPKARFNVLKAKFAPTFRRNFVDAETAEAAQQFTELRKASETKTRQQDSQNTAARKAYGKLGMSVPPANRQRPETTEAAARLVELLNDSETE